MTGSMYRSMRRIPAAWLLCAGLAAGLVAVIERAPRAQDGQDTEAMAEMMARAKRYTQPGVHHELLERFLGTWRTETRMFMNGKPTPATEGTCTYSWLMEGRWLQSRTNGELMGQPVEGAAILGYDNFKQSYVQTAVSSMDTAMLRAEGDLTPNGAALILYGTLDEYLTGEHDKMVKYAYRFDGPDRFTLEVHDLPIGEVNTKVVEIDFRREEGR